jgi:hypothetical protein
MTGDIVMSAGDRSKEFYLILFGSVSIFDIIQEKEVAVLSEG